MWSLIENSHVTTVSPVGAGDAVGAGDRVGSGVGPDPPHAQHCDDSLQYATLLLCATQWPSWPSHALPPHSPYSSVEPQPAGHDHVPSLS